MSSDVRSNCLFSLNEPDDDIFERIAFYVRACDFSLKKSHVLVEWKFSFKITVVKVLTWSNGNSAIGFPIVQTTVKDS